MTAEEIDILFFLSGPVGKRAATRDESVIDWFSWATREVWQQDLFQFLQFIHNEGVTSAVHRQMQLFVFSQERRKKPKGTKKIFKLSWISIRNQ